MKKYGIIFGLILALVACAADAKPRHHRQTWRSDRFIVQNTSNRPSDCAGIKWCGCWLRHQFGIADSSLNLAASWMRYPHADAHSANIVVWPNRHHVGKVLRIEGNKMEVISGNSGRGGVTTRWVPITRGFSFHKV